MANENIVLTFTEIDDAVKVYLNNDVEPIFSHDHGSPLRHNMDPLTCDLGSHLSEGRNILQVVAENGPASATLVGNISADEKVVVKWEERPGHVGQGEFYKETFEFVYENGMIRHRQLVHALLTFTQIDDFVTVILNGHEILNTHGQPPLRYNMEPRTIEITNGDLLLQDGSNELRIVAENGPGSAALVGRIHGVNQQDEEEVIHEWKQHPGHVGKGVFVDETFSFEFKGDVVTFLL